jgi:hypothetical protein
LASVDPVSVHAVLDEAWAEELEQSIESRDMQSPKRERRAKPRESVAVKNEAS